MIDLKSLRENPQRFRDGAARKGIDVDFDRLLRLEEEHRAAITQRETLRAEQKKIEKELGPQMGQLAGRLKKAAGMEKEELERELAGLKAKPAALKGQIGELETVVARLEPELHSLLLTVPLPPDGDVPVGKGAEENVEVRRWVSPALDPGKPFEGQRGFKPKSHIDLVRDLGLADFPRGVKMAGSRSYVLTGDGMLLHQAVLRYAFDFMAHKHGFTPMSVPVVVREECMVGTGFFPAGREQAYHIEESKRGGTHDLFLTGTGEVGLMGLHEGEILDEATLPRKYVTVSTCFRREAGAAGKDTAGLYRIHQFDKVEQVVICKADEAESRGWHKRMIGFVEELLQGLELPYRLLQCCTGDLGPKNADMVDVECWMPGRGEPAKDGTTPGAFGETHSASRLYDFQCRRLNMRYRPGGEKGQGPTTFCHSLNNTVGASPRLMIPILEIHQQADGSVRVRGPLRAYMGGKERIGWEGRRGAQARAASTVGNMGMTVLRRQRSKVRAISGWAAAMVTWPPWSFTFFSSVTSRPIARLEMKVRLARSSTRRWGRAASRRVTLFSSTSLVAAPAEPTRLTTVAPPRSCTFTLRLSICGSRSRLGICKDTTFRGLGVGFAGRLSARAWARSAQRAWWTETRVRAS